jgi:putative transposase
MQQGSELLGGLCANVLVWSVRTGVPLSDIAHLFDKINDMSRSDRVSMVVHGYQFALDPTPAQDALLRSHCGAQRFAYNWGLAQVKASLDQRAAEKTYDIDTEALTPALSWSAYCLRKTWNQAKDKVAPWWRENSKEAYSSGLANLATALGNWAGSRSGARRGQTVRFPRFKGRRAGMSCRFTTGAFGLVDTDRRHVRLPRIGTVRTHESTRKLARHVERGTARVRSATLAHRAGRWHVSFSVEITRRDPAPVRPEAVVGVDLGVKSLAVLSTGEVIPNPRHLEVALRALRRLQRQAARRHGPDRRTRRQPSQRWCATQARISRLHTRVANARRDGLHKLTSRLSATQGTIVVEDLHVCGMLRNRCLARRIAGVGWGELRRQLGYKTGWLGGRLVVADRWFASSKMCSGCGVVKAKLRLAERTFRCQACGLVLDRDLNAARNLAALVSSHSWWATGNEPDGNPGKTRTARATGIATGRPGLGGPGQRRHRKVTAARTDWTHIHSPSGNGF